MEQLQKNNKDFFHTILLLLAAIALVSLVIMFWEKDNMRIKEKSFSGNLNILTEQDIKNLVDGLNEEVDEDRLVFNVSQRTKGPKITKVIIAPQKVSRGQEQYLEVWVKDEQGVASVQTETELDGGFVKKLDMELFEGDAKNGKWKVTWVVHDTHDKTYNTKFMTASIDGRNSEITYAWLDPCSPPLSGVWNVNINQFCDNTGIVGSTDNIIIADSINLTVSSTALVFPPFRSISLGMDSSITILNGATIEKAYMVVRDLDGDRQYAQGASINLITATTTVLENRVVGVETVQGKWINGEWYTSLSSLRSPQGGDCYDADTEGARNTFAGQTQFFTVPNGLGGAIAQWDYDCNNNIEFGDEYWGTCVGGVEFERDKHWTNYYGGCQTTEGGWFYCEEIGGPVECGRSTSPAMQIWFNNPMCGPEAYTLTGNAFETVIAACK